MGKAYVLITNYEHNLSKISNICYFFISLYVRYSPVEVSFFVWVWMVSSLL